MMTTGEATVCAIDGFGDSSPDELLRLAASLDQVSRDEFAPRLVRAAHDRDLVLSVPSDVLEELPYGIRGRVDGRCVALGTSDGVVAGAILIGTPVATKQGSAWPDECWCLYA